MPVSGQTAAAIRSNIIRRPRLPSPATPCPALPSARALAPSLAVAGLLALANIDPVLAQDAGNAPAQTLPEVRVTADASPEDLPAPYAGGQVARGARLGVLGNTSIMKAPFNVSSYTAQMIQDQQSPTVADAVNKDPSVRFTGLPGGNIDNFYIRGFPVGEGNTGEIAFDGLYGVAPNYRVFTDYVERVEVIKGPAAMLYGMSPNSGVGGVINIVPKRAHEDLASVTASYASDTQLGGHVDVSRRFGESREWGVRFNGSYYQGDTPMDNQSRQAAIGALSLDYQGKRLRASLDVIGQQEKLDAPGRAFIMGPGLQSIPGAPDGRRNVTQPWEWTRGTDESLLFRTEYDITDQLTVFADAGGGWTQLSRLFGTTPQILNAQGDTLSTPTYYKFKVDRATYDAGLRGRFHTGPVRHAVTFQASAYADSLDRANTTGTPVASNLYNPVGRPAQDLPAPASVPRVSDNDQTGFSLADTLSALDDRVLLTLGVRQQRIRSRNFSPAGAVTSSYDESATTPMAGLVVQPWKRVSFYANYIQGLSKGDVAPPTASNSGQVFAPYKTRQYEVGTKVDLGRFTATLAAFQITKPSGQLTGNVFSINGEQRNRGLELNLFGEAAPGVRLLGGVALIDGEITESGTPAAVGKTAIGVPRVQANLGAEWDLPWVAGLTVTGAMIYTDRQYVNQLNTASLPSWTKFDVGARYRTRIAGKATTLRANILNVFDRDYWSGVTSWGGFSQAAPRTVLLSATVEF
ncbi:TonB-dependent siderophore receptor [Cupriavidus sp. WKF15]|uniref:TonB-dependent receptor n=1 Tax=Cupriavidus sp. WKF15 TaxID=3032282 RepID=UPI0023E1C438|nr:TonB-dependent siderophore receptor [Cupriavidus sp. WKF15]WER47954.1 TonB-dependent siderophore receptor [Cupriavidus sp. WKF15]